MTECQSRWRRRAIYLFVGLLGYVALFYDMAGDGGVEAAFFFGTFGFAIWYPLLLLLGRAVGAVIGRFRTLDGRARLAITVAPTLLVAGLTAHEGHRARDPVAKFERWIASPAPPGVQVEAAFTLKGINFWVWAFHFKVDPDGLPKILGQRAYQHEINPAGFDLEQVRATNWGRPNYPIPPPRFRAIHRYWFHAPTERAGYNVTLYGDAAQDEFFAYGNVE